MIKQIGNTQQFIATTQTEKKRAQSTQKEEKIGRVEEIKQQIQKGEYKIDLDKTAKAFADSLL